MAKTILIVEDNALNMKLFGDLLEAKGYATLRAAEGNDALAIASRERPDLVLMDIQLPGMSGMEVTRRLKSDPALRDIPVVAVTAFALRSDEARIMESGCAAYMAKPVSIDRLLAMVERHAA
ncbi:MAG: response regulator [Tagaea sp.]|nr:response regulator [Tagaea sp.]